MMNEFSQIEEVMQNKDANGRLVRSMVRLRGKRNFIYHREDGPAFVTPRVCMHFIMGKRVRMHLYKQLKYMEYYV